MDKVTEELTSTQHGIERTTMVLGAGAFGKNYTEEVEDTINSLERDLVEMRSKNSFLETKLRESEKVSQPDDSVQNTRIQDLMKANQQLKIELMDARQSIGEVMLIAKQQAKEMIDEAENQVSVTLENANQELLDVGFKASQINSAVKKSQSEVNDMYEELISSLTELTEKEFNS